MRTAMAAVVLAFLAQAAIHAEVHKVRAWSNSGRDDGSIHSMGNGDLIAYGHGPNVPFFYGPPYSTCGILSLTTECDQELTDEATREVGTAVWNHSMKIDGQPAVTFTEFAAADSPAYVRLVECQNAGARWTIHPNGSAKFGPVKDHPGVWLQSIRPGQRIFNYPSNFWSHHWVIAQGACKGELGPDGEIIVHIEQGKGYLAIIGSTDLPSGTLAVEKLLNAGAESLLGPTRRDWQQFTSRCLAARPLPKGTSPEIAEVLDSVAVLLRSQQARSGGEMAGPYYPLAYIRDQYGVARGMLALGMFEEAKLNLDFRFAKFQRFGDLLTAEAMGTDCARHRHENDEVEGPGYTILQTRDYIRATGDHAFGRKVWPMLEWCWQVQQKHLVQGLLNFSGDETYVAGGFFPRSGLIQGSADTTLVFIESGKWLSQWAVEQKLWTSEQANEAMRLVDTSRTAYRKWFWDKDHVWANAPERETMMDDPPRFRHGVCEGACGWFGWTERTPAGRYVYPECRATKDLPAAAPARMEVNSVSLLPAYLGSDILSDAELRALLDHVMSQANSSGHIPSVPGTDGCVGYDPGLVLLNAVKSGHPSSSSAYDRLMRFLDPTQAWNEYYDGRDGVRAGCCRCRPWESGVNAEAVVSYLSAPQGS